MLQQVFVIIFVQQELYRGVRLVVRIPETEGKILQ